MDEAQDDLEVDDKDADKLAGPTSRQSGTPSSSACSPSSRRWVRSGGALGTDCDEANAALGNAKKAAEDAESTAIPAGDAAQSSLEGMAQSATDLLDSLEYLVKGALEDPVDTLEGRVVELTTFFEDELGKVTDLLTGPVLQEINTAKLTAEAWAEMVENAALEAFAYIDRRLYRLRRAPGADRRHPQRAGIRADGRERGQDRHLRGGRRAAPPR